MVRLMSLERENIPLTEQRYFSLPGYSRDGSIPSWSEVVVKYNLDRLHPRDFRLLRGYYRAQRRLAEGSPKKAKRIFAGLDHSPDFKTLEDRGGQLLHDIASYIRGPSEKKRTR
jgi:hypothetical protein